MLRPAVALLRQQRREHSALRRHRIDGVLHHRQLARGDRPQRGARAGADADGMLHFAAVEVQHASSNDGRDKRRQRRMVPAPLANSRERRLAQPHLELMPQHQADNQLAPVAAGALAAGHRRRKDVRRMRRVLLPVDVVVVHAADHQRIGQRRGDRVHRLSRANDRRLARPGNLVQHFQRDDHVVLLIAAQRASHAVEQKALRLVNRVLGKVFELQSRRPLRHGGGDGRLRCGLGGRGRCGGRHTNLLLVTCPGS